METFSKNIYKLPVRKEQLEGIVTKQTMLSGELKSHVKNFSNAIDFLVPMDGQAIAALDGVVTSIKDDDKVGGPDLKYKWGGNYVTLKHANEEFSVYLHLKYKGVVVKVGDNVKQGQLLGYVGMTGYTHRPHLHFEVFIWPSPSATPHERETIKVRFEEFENIYDVGK